jgi:hypothetical protein
VLARTTLTVDAWAVAVRRPVADAGSGTAAWGMSDVLRLAPLRALVGCALALVVLGSLAAINRFPVGSPVAYAGRLAPTHVVVVDPPAPPPTIAPPTTAAAVATAAIPSTTSPVLLPKPKPKPPVFSLSGTSGGVWAALRQCESGGNYQENTGNGFYGAYQFTESTWTGLGYPGRPDLEPPAMQDQGAQRLQARSGWGQWPACSRKLGLS